LEAFRATFVQRGVERHDDVDEAKAQAIFDKLTGFSQYGFPRAHSAAFAILAYQSAWLRHYYGAHWYVALLNAQPMGFYNPNALLSDAKHQGIVALPADVNASHMLCTVEGDAIRIGLGMVNGISYDDATALYRERQERGPFADLADLCRRAPSRDDQIEQLIAAGATECFGGTRREQLWQVGTIARPRREQEALAITPPEAPKLSQLSLWDEVVSDFATTGLSTRVHPMELLRDVLPSHIRPTNTIREAGDGTWVETAGMLIAVQRPGTAKGMVFALLEDEFGTVNAVFKPDLGKKLRARLRAERILRIGGFVQIRKGILSIQATEAQLMPASVRRDLSRAPAGKMFS
jgi:error-prone DNA polymerase